MIGSKKTGQTSKPFGFFINVCTYALGIMYQSVNRATTFLNMHRSVSDLCHAHTTAFNCWLQPGHGTKMANWLRQVCKSRLRLRRFDKLIVRAHVLMTLENVLFLAFSCFFFRICWKYFVPFVSPGTPFSGVHSLPIPISLSSKNCLLPTEEKLPVVWSRHAGKWEFQPLPYTANPTPRPSMC